MKERTFIVMNEPYTLTAEPESIDVGLCFPVPVYADPTIPGFKTQFPSMVERRIRNKAADILVKDKYPDLCPTTTPIHLVNRWAGKTVTNDQSHNDFVAFRNTSIDGITLKPELVINTVTGEVTKYQY